MSSAEGESGSPQIFSALVAEMLTAEDKRRDSLETRGNSVITVSGTLVTLLLALAAFVTAGKSVRLPNGARITLGLAVVAFVLAALLAIATYVPQPARITDPGELAAVLPSMWDRGTDYALKRSTATRLEQLTSAQLVNDRKARALLAAVVAQLIAVVLLASAILETV